MISNSNALTSMGGAIVLSAIFCLIMAIYEILKHTVDLNKGLESILSISPEEIIYNTLFKIPSEQLGRIRYIILIYPHLFFTGVAVVASGVIGW